MDTKLLSEIKTDVRITKIPYLSRKWEVVIGRYIARNEDLDKAILEAIALHRKACDETT